MNSITVSFLQLSIVLLTRKPDSGYILIYLMYLIWPFAASSCSPTLWVWKLIVHTPSQIRWYYDLQSIDIPPSVERNIFNNIIIEGHFQCALPLQCMPNGEAANNPSYKLWNYGVHYGLPVMTFVYGRFCENVSVIRQFCETLQADTHLKMIERQLFVKQVKRLTTVYFVLWTPYYLFGFAFWLFTTPIYICSSGFIFNQLFFIPAYKVGS